MNDGELLRQRRRDRGLSQKQFASRIGVSREMVSLMERGHKKVSNRTWAAVQGVEPKALERPMAFDEPIINRLEIALMTAGMAYIANHEVGGIPVDFWLEDLNVAVCVAAGRTTRRFPKNIPFDLITVSGAASLLAFTTLIERAGIHARLEAKYSALGAQG